MHFNSRVQDLSRQANSAGVEIPIVRETDLRSRIVLLSVPVDARFRSALRIYDVSGHATSVRLRIFGVNSNDAIVDTSIVLGDPPITADNAYPAQANIFDLVASYEGLRSVAALRIEIDGTSSSLWAFVSTTNNESQEVTIVTPN